MVTGTATTSDGASVGRSASGDGTSIVVVVDDAGPVSVAGAVSMGSVTGGSVGGAAGSGTVPSVMLGPVSAVLRVSSPDEQPTVARVNAARATPMIEPRTFTG